jgi:hypothetical protein
MSNHRGKIGEAVAMTLDQGLAFGIIIVTMGLFAWGRWRYDLVAATALVAAIATGIVSPDQAFKGFSDDIVIIVASALVVSAAVARSGVIERVVRRLGPYLLTIDRQVIALVASVTLLSAFIKNIGHAALSLHQEYRRARHAHADRVSACAAHQNFSVFAADADVIWRTVSETTACNAPTPKMRARNEGLPERYPPRRTLRVRSTSTNSSLKCCH